MPDADPPPSRSDHDRREETGSAVKELFSAVLDAEDEGKDIQDVLEGVNASLREAVEGLLAAHRRASGRLLESRDDGETGWTSLGGSARPGRRGESGPIEIDPPLIEGYEIGEEIGRGGFGVVYRARQRWPVERAVAVKLLRNELASARVISLFRAESRVLARMNHPGIARVLDAGLDARSRPYVAMELVNGLPILAACESHELTVRERVEVMAQVCEAVHHAHLRAIIHRDLKPANILVERVDGNARPRVIDFGVAKLLEDEGEQGMTITGDKLGTPRYMSPEQSTGQDADARTDIYALGVVLCEVLTGRVPGDAPGAKASGRSGGRSGGRLDGGLGSGSGNRSGSGVFAARVRPSTLAEADPKTASRAKALRGDLDRIVLKAAAHYPESRYFSAMAMAQDLRRYLDGLPVLATPPGPVYLTRKFIGRHRAVSVAAALAVLAMLGGATALSYGLREARLGQIRAETALDAAQQERERAEAISAFLLGDMLSAINPDLYRGGDRSLSEILAGTATQAKQQLGENPVLLSEVLSRIGSAQRSIADVAGATDSFGAAAQLAMQEHGPSDERALSLRIDALLSALSARRNIDHEELIDEIVRDASSAHAESSDIVLRSRLHRAHLVQGLDALEQMHEIERAITSSGRSGSDLHFEVLQHLATALRLVDPAQSLEVLELVISDALARHGEMHSRTMELELNRVEALRALDMLDEAERSVERLLQRTRSLGGKVNLYHRLALLNMMQIARTRGETLRSIELALEHLETARAVHGEGSVHEASALRLLARCQADAGDAGLAIETLRRSIWMYEAAESPAFVNALNTRIELGRMLLDGGDTPGVRDAVLPVLEHLRPGHRVRTAAMLLLADAIEANGDPAEARRIVREELELFGPDADIPHALKAWLESRDAL
ncbi:MAG: protein kinase domain-containing protein [Phycisphaerales bacterium]